MNAFSRPHYSKAPIAEAIIDIKFANPEAIDIAGLSRVADSLAGTFPTRSPMHHLEVGFKIDEHSADQSASLTNNHEQIGWRLMSQNNNRILQLQRIGFTLNHLPPYTSWQSFRDEALSYWSNLRAEFGDRIAATRLAVRVINQIPVPREGVQIEEYLSVYPCMPEKEPQTVEAFFLQLQTRQVHIFPEARAIINVGSNPETDRHFLLLDIDLFANRTVSEDGQIWEIIDRFGLEKDVIFENCITDKVREVIR